MPVAFLYVNRELSFNLVHVAQYLIFRPLEMFQGDAVLLVEKRLGDSHVDEPFQCAGREAGSSTCKKRQKPRIHDALFGRSSLGSGQVTGPNRRGTVHLDLVQIPEDQTNNKPIECQIVN